MANKIYSPNSRLSKFRQACNRNTQSHVTSSTWNGYPYAIAKTSCKSGIDIGYIYYDTDFNTSSGFIFVSRSNYSLPTQNFKQVCFSSCLRLFRIGAYTYYRVDATDLLHGKQHDKS